MLESGFLHHGEYVGMLLAVVEDDDATIVEAFDGIIQAPIAFDTINEKDIKRWS